MIYIQFALNGFYKYCDKWKLTVNISKTKVVVYSLKVAVCFTYNGFHVKIVKEFNILV